MGRVNGKAMEFRDISRGMTDGRGYRARLLAAITVLATAAAGYLAAPLLVVPMAAVALMADGVIATAVRLRRLSPEPPSSNAVTYLVIGAIGWLLTAWLAYLAGATLRGM